MATIPVKDGNSTTVNFEVSGAGTVGDPYRNVSERRITRPTSVTNANGSTSATPNAWTQVLAANSSRSYFQIQNSSDTDQEIAFSPSSSEVVAILLKPGAAYWEDGSDIYSGRIAIRCAVASKSYLAWER